MNPAVIFAEGVLIGVFVISAVAKALDLSGSRAAVAGFGVPAPLVPATTFLLPVLELLGAAALLSGSTARAGAALLTLLLLAFTVGIAVNLLRGNLVDCHCFGSLGSKPLSWSLVGRNLLLISLAVLVLVAPASWVKPGLVEELARMTAAGATVTIALIILALVSGLALWLFTSLLRRHGALLTRVEALEGEQLAAALRDGRGGTILPAHTGITLTGEPISTTDLIEHGLPDLLVFMRPGCGPCEALLPDIARWSEEYGDLLHVAVISSGGLEDNRTKFADYAGLAVLIDTDGRYADSLGLDGTPAALLVGLDGRIAGGPAFGAHDIAGLLRPFASSHGAPLTIEPRPLGPGDPLPDVEVRTLAGDAVDLVSVAAEDAVLLFWDPDCGFAQQIKDSVSTWWGQSERPRLVVVSRGHREAVEAEGFGDLTLLDPSFAAGSAVGAPGTPSAVAVSQGALASAVAVGGPEVMDLLVSQTDTSELSRTDTLETGLAETSR